MSTTDLSFFSLLDVESLEEREGCYLIHFDEKMGHAGHYVGYAKNIRARIIEHLKTVAVPPDRSAGEVTWKIVEGKGAKLLGIANFRNISFSVPRVWYDKDRSFETSLKDWHGARRFCPSCVGADKAYNRARG